MEFETLTKGGATYVPDTEARRAAFLAAGWEPVPAPKPEADTEDKEPAKKPKKGGKK